MGLFDALLSGKKGQDDEGLFNDKQLADFVKKKVEDVRKNSVRITNESIWMRNIAYLCGVTGVYYDTQTRQYVPTDKALKYIPRNRLTVNKILPTVQNRLARLTKRRPKFQVRPNSNQQEDRDASVLANQILDMVWEKEEMATKVIELIMWAQETGHAYLKCNWDPSMGKQIINPETGETEYEGDIRIDVVSPFEIFPDPLAKSFRDIQWIVQAKVRRLDYFKTHYPERGGEVKEEETWLLSAQYENRINSLAGTYSNGSGINMNVKHSAIEMIYYEKRSSKHPNGRMIVVANGVTLEDKELPCGEIPFVKFDDILVAGKYYSESLITHLVPIQDQYNRVITRRSQWVNKMLCGKYMAARGAELTQESLNDQNGEVLEYTPVPNAAPPSPMDIPQIPAYAYKEEESLDMQFGEISGINEVSKGQLPSSTLSAIGMQFLSEQDDTRIGIVARRHELGMAQFGRIILLFIEKYYKTPRILKIAGQNMQYMVKEFLGADVKGNTDVVVIEGSTLPGSITAKRDFILTLRREGLLGNPQDPKANEKVLKMVEFGDIDDIWGDYSLDMAQIKQSIDSIEAGEPPEPPSEFDNNELHLLEKNRLRKSDKFKTLSPASQQMLMADMEMRLQLVIQKNNPQLGLQDTQAQLMQDQAQDETLGMEAQAGAVPTEEQLGLEEVQPTIEGI